jgi:hypothetical protein
VLVAGTGVGVGDAVGVAVAGTAVAVDTAVFVAVGTPVAAGVAVVVGSAVGVTVAPDTAVAVAVAVATTGVAVGVATTVAIAVGLGVAGALARISSRSRVTGFDPDWWTTSRTLRTPEPVSAIDACPPDPWAMVPMLVPPTMTSKKPPLPAMDNTSRAAAEPSTLNETSRPSLVVWWYLPPAAPASVTTYQSSE